MHALFPGQQSNEKIFLVVRQHWVVLVKRLIVWAVLAVALAVFRYMISSLGPSINTELVNGMVYLGTQIYFLFLLVSLLIIWVVYYLNMYIITNERIVDVDQIGLFSHTAAELNIEKIEDVTSEVNGVLGQVFDYGTVYIQTAGTRERFDFKNVPNPDKITKLILSLYEKNTTNQPHKPI